MFKHIYILSGLLVFALTTSCLNIETASEVPSVTFLEFRTGMMDDDGSYVPYGEIEFKFSDGDGDFGVYENIASDSLLPDTLRYNLFLIPLSKIDSTTYIPAKPDGDTTGVTIFYDEKLSRQGQYRLIDGIITYRLTISPLPIYSLDTFRFAFYIYDRALNKSIPDTTYDLCFKNLVQ